MRAAHLRWMAAAFLLLRTAAFGNDYVDARQCATCHAKIAATYAKTGMAQSFYRPQSRETARYFHEPSQTWYAMGKRGTEYFQRRWRIGFDGQEVDISESRIDYVMGSGNHVRTYLHRNERGALIELPLAWYAEKGGTWALNPGHDLPYSLPPRSVAYECMFCHNAYPKIPAGHDEPGSEPLFTGELPLGIDCQRCHGPGSDHIQAAQTAGTSVARIRMAILNPARLGKDRQMEVCMQCHLETTSLQLPHSIQKFGRTPFSYNPAEPLASFILYFDHAAGSKYEDDFEIAHSAYRLRKSKCFLESAMTCTTCHDPHDIPRGINASVHYNGVCGQCHKQLTTSHPAAPDCVGCHMPKRRTQDVIHAVMTDHYIQRRPPVGDLLAPLAERHEPDSQQYRGPVIPYYPQTLSTQDSLYNAIAQVAQRSNLSVGLPRLAAQIEFRKPPRPEPFIELGAAWLTVHRPANAVRAFDEAVKREPDSPVALLDLAGALTAAGQKGRALEVLRHGVRVAPDDPLLWYQLGVTSHSAAALEHAAALDSGMGEPRNMLGESLAEAGDMDRAEKAFREVLRINPDFAEAQGNLGHLLAARGNLPEAAHYFARSVLLKPDDSQVHLNYAVTLAGLNRFEEAQVQTEAAIKTDPNLPEAHNFRGTLILRAGQPDAALREFLEAIRLRPGFGLAHLNAAAVLAAKGDTEGARFHREAAARNPRPH